MTKNKHDHTATKKIKAWLFAIMLLLPFLFLLPTALYYGLNQNAQLSERTEQQPVYYQSNDVTQVSDIVVGNIYMWNDNFVATQTFSTAQYYLSIESDNLYDIFTINGTINSVSLYANTSGSIRLSIVTTNGTQFESIENKRFYFIAVAQLNQFSSIDYCINSISKYEGYIIKEYTPITTTNDVSTSIINAWNSTWQNPLFSWTSYSPFYAPMQSFTNVFGINDMQIANVLTYLATITAIYIVFDIIIELFTYLTHLIPRSD